MFTIISKKILCPIDNSEKTIFLKQIIVNDKRILSSEGCADYHGAQQCEVCLRKESTIADFSLLSDSPKQ